MKCQLALFTISLCLTACTENQQEHANQPVATQASSIDSTTLANSLPAPAKVDTFFFTNLRYKQIGDLNQLDMFRLNPTGELLVCGKAVSEIKYKPGDSLIGFLTTNLTGTEQLDLRKVRYVSWATDLRGDDDTYFFFKANHLLKVVQSEDPDFDRLLAGVH